MKILITRHGETSWNKQNKVLGRTDIPLNETGIHQAKELVEKLKDVSIQAVYASPLERAFRTGSLVAEDQETAKLFLGDRNTPIVIDEHFKEMNFGIYEGVSRDNPEYQAEKRKFFSKYPEGESFMDVAGRVYPFLDKLRRNYDDETVLIVSHNGICRVIANYFENMTNEEFASFTIGNCEVREYTL